MVALVVFLLLTPTLSLAAQEQEDEQFVPTYGLGDQMISLNLGLFIPLFFSGGPDGITATNLSLGATGHLAWSGYLSDSMAVGGEFGGMFAFSPNSNPLYMIPLAARFTYIIRRYPFEFPLTLAGGINFVTYNESFKVDPILIPGAGVYWNLDTEWAFGVDLRYWIVPQLYLGQSGISSDDNRLGNFLAITASVLYRF